MGKAFLEKPPFKGYDEWDLALSGLRPDDEAGVLPVENPQNGFAYARTARFEAPIVGGLTFFGVEMKWKLEVLTSALPGALVVFRQTVLLRFTVVVEFSFGFIGDAFWYPDRHIVSTEIVDGKNYPPRPLPPYESLPQAANDEERYQKSGAWQAVDMPKATPFSETISFLDFSLADSNPPATTGNLPIEFNYYSAPYKMRVLPGYAVRLAKTSDASRWRQAEFKFGFKKGEPGLSSTLNPFRYENVARGEGSGVVVTRSDPYYSARQRLIRIPQAADASVWRDDSDRLWIAYWAGDGQQRAYGIIYSDDGGASLAGFYRGETRMKTFATNIWGPSYQTVRTNGRAPGFVVSVASKDGRLYAACSVDDFRVRPISGAEKIEGLGDFTLLPFANADGREGYRVSDGQKWSYTTQDGLKWEEEAIE